MNTDILDKPIAFHRCFVPLTGSVNAALMLSQAMYWQKRNEDGVWWFQTQEKWADETGLSRREQETARRALRNLPFWKEELRGLPGKLHFFLDLELLLEIVTVGKTSLHKPAILDSTNQPYSDGGTSHTSSKVKESNEETYLSPPSAESENHGSESTNSKESLALAIYKSYPRKLAKKDALRAILKAMKAHSFDYLLERTAKYAECTRAWPESDVKFIPYPASWFNGERYEDDESNWIRKASVETFPQLSQKAFALRTAIQEHVANREYIGAVDNPTQEQFADLRSLRSQLSEVESKMASIRK
jgi:hypothetical protein